MMKCIVAMRHLQASTMIPIMRNRPNGHSTTIKHCHSVTHTRAALRSCSGAL